MRSDDTFAQSMTLSIDSTMQNIREIMEHPKIEATAFHKSLSDDAKLKDFLDEVYEFLRNVDFNLLNEAFNIGMLVEFLGMISNSTHCFQEW
eukprot:UN24715